MEKQAEAEVWAVIECAPAYQVSTFGRVRNRHGRIIKHHVVRGYPEIRFWNNRKRTAKKLHHIVALTFLGPRPAGLIIRHLDGNAFNARLDNLKYGTHLENEEDKRRHGTHARGETNGNSRLNSAQVAEIKSLYVFGSRGQGVRVLAKRYGVHRSTIQRIVKGETWNPAQQAA